VNSWTAAARAHSAATAADCDGVHGVDAALVARVNDDCVRACTPHAGGHTHCCGSACISLRATQLQAEVSRTNWEKKGSSGVNGTAWRACYQSAIP
jgi:hypothetical protein